MFGVVSAGLRLAGRRGGNGTLAKLAVTRICLTCSFANGARRNCPANACRDDNEAAVQTARVASTAIAVFAETNEDLKRRIGISCLSSEEARRSCVVIGRVTVMRVTVLIGGIAANRAAQWMTGV